MRDDLRCSTLTRALGEDPGGTASPWDTIALAELPLPWPDHIERHPLVDTVDLTRPGTRLLGLADSTHPGDSPTDRLRLVSYRRGPTGPFTAFTGTVTDHAPEALAGAIAEALAVPAPSPPAAGPAPSVSDVLVCTHGSRDRCCGKFGMELFDQVCGRVTDGTRRWRTSHTGGHRFAPTALTLPDGYLWAHLDADLLTGIVDRTGDPVQAAAHLRGSVGIGAAPAQLIDRAGLAAHGWDWLGARRRASVRDDRVELEWSSPSLGNGTARARLVAGADMPVPPCGEALPAGGKTTSTWSLDQLDWS